MRWNLVQQKGPYEALLIRLRTYLVRFAVRGGDDDMRLGDGSLVGEVAYW